MLLIEVLNVESYNYGTLPSQVPTRKMEHESTAKINSLLVAKISGSWRTSAIKNNFRDIVFVIVTEL